MSYKASFLDNQVVGVDDFNSIVSNLIGAGVVTTDFNAAESYMLSKMNDVTKDAVETAGVVPESEGSLMCTLSGNTVTIAEGSAVFASGVNFKVTGSETLEIETGETQYVYLKHDVIQNTAAPCVSGDGFPSDAEDSLYVVPLCVVEDGAVTDMRKYARGKLQAPSDWNGTKVQTMYTPYNSNTNISRTEEIELDVGGDRINFLVFVSSDDLAVVTETEDGEFNVVTSKLSSKSTTIQLYIGASNIYFAYITGFRRDEYGRLLCKWLYQAPAAHEYTLYSSVYSEEASE